LLINLEIPLSGSKYGFLFRGFLADFINVNDFDFKNMTLHEAVKLVIKQNKSRGCVPTRFITMTQDGNAENLEEIISKLVLKKELLEYLEKGIQKYGNLLSIEDLIANKDDGFNLSKDVIREANARAEWFDRLRGTNQFGLSYIL
jgi:hypothetical protein